MPRQSANPKPTPAAPDQDVVVAAPAPVADPAPIPPAPSYTFVDDLVQGLYLQAVEHGDGCTVVQRFNDQVFSVITYPTPDDAIKARDALQDHLNVVANAATSAAYIFEVL